MHTIVRWAALAAVLCLPAFTASAIPVESLRHSRPAADASPIPGSFVAVTADTSAGFASQKTQSMSTSGGDFSGILSATRKITKSVGVAVARAGLTGSGGGVPVPEPATLGLIAAGCLLSALLRR